ncbi:hypothetical protein Asp14428_62660 [Actinoplanes sp. NBRC 14428]|nr:hypothetical protein Asp14428_62660 [Actinoplanes sp. NBRC 14428]
MVRREDLEPPGRTLPGRAAPPPVRRSRTGRRDAPLDHTRGRTLIMAAKPKPQPSDDAREQARRALQTSMDTRQ